MHTRFKIPIFIVTILIFSFVPIKAQGYLIGPDDVLKIAAYRKEDMDRTARVSSERSAEPTPEDLINKDVGKEYVVQPDDILEIAVYGEEDLTKIARVSQDGCITYPLLGRVFANGLTVSELEQKLTDLLEEDYLVNPQVGVFVKEFAGIYIYGQIEKPGCYPLGRDLTVFEAITLAGGFTSIAAANGTKVLRQENGEKSYKGKNRQYCQNRR